VLKDSLDFKSGKEDTFTVIIATISNSKDHSPMIKNTLEFTKDVANI